MGEGRCRQVHAGGGDPRNNPMQNTSDLDDSTGITRLAIDESIDIVHADELGPGKTEQGCETGLKTTNVNAFSLLK